MEKWHDPDSSRDVWVVAIDGAAEWPAAVPWTCAGFGVLLLAQHVVDVAPLAERALDQGLAVASAWGPAAEVIEDALDEIIARKRGAQSREVVVTTHTHESIEETLELFLDAIVPARPRAKTCRAWCIVAFSDDLARAARRALEHRGAHRVP